MKGLSKEFVDDAHNARTNHQWGEFIKKYGTHYVYYGIFGARATQQMEFSYAGNAAIKAIGKNIQYGAMYKFAKSYGDKTYQSATYEAHYKYVKEFVLNEK